MANSSSNTLQLPKSVLAMKFMRRTKEKIDKERENTENHDSLYSDVTKDQMRTASTCNFVTESSFVLCEDLVEGRLSFKGMNPEIERLMELENKKNQPDDDMLKDVPDDILLKKMKAFNKLKRPHNDSTSEYKMVKKKFN